jgi:hypothetical protein
MGQPAFRVDTEASPAAHVSLVRKRCSAGAALQPRAPARTWARAGGVVQQGAARLGYASVLPRTQHQRPRQQQARPEGRRDAGGAAPVVPQHHLRYSTQAPVVIPPTAHSWWLCSLIVPALVRWATYTLPAGGMCGCTALKHSSVASRLKVVGKIAVQQQVCRPSYPSESGFVQVGGGPRQLPCHTAHT